MKQLRYLVQIGYTRVFGYGLGKFSALITGPGLSVTGYGRNPVTALSAAFRKAASGVSGPARKKSRRYRLS